MNNNKIIKYCVFIISMIIPYNNTIVIQVKKIQLIYNIIYSWLFIYDKQIIEY